MPPPKLVQYDISPHLIDRFYIFEKLNKPSVLETKLFLVEKYSILGVLSITKQVNN